MQFDDKYSWLLYAENYKKRKKNDLIYLFI